MTIKIENCSAITPQFYVYGDEGSGTQTTFTLTKPGKKKIIQFVGGTGAISDTIEVEVLAPINPDFDVFLCQNNGVSVQITNPGDYDVFFINYGQRRDTISSDQTSYFYYPSEGQQSVEIQGNYVDTAGNFGSVNCGKSKKNFSVQSGLSALQIQSIVSRDDSLIFQTENRPNYLSFLRERQGDGSTIDLARNQSSRLAVAGDRPRCFRLTVKDNCSDADIEGEWICSMVLEAQVQQDQVELSWPKYPVDGFVRYNLYRDGSLIFASTNVSVLRYFDKDVRCLQQYCYQIEVITAAAKVLSDSVCVVANSAVRPPAPKLVAAGVLSDSVIEIFWRVPENSAIALTLLSGNLSAQTASARIRDTTVSPQIQSYCYYLSTLDSCGNRSLDSVGVCSIFLSAVKLERDNVLTWTAFQGFDNDFSYRVQVLNTKGQLLREIDPLQSESYRDAAANFSAKSQVYRIKAMSNQEPALFVYSNALLVEEQHIIRLPTAFTPNGDGLNDQLVVFSQTAASIELSIYNRWGEKVFTSTSIDEGWDGTYRGQAAPAGVYTVQIEGKDVFGESFRITERVQLIR